jgi:uncharacterized protein YuzE
MTSAYLEVTYKHGRAIAAYFYLPRQGRHKATSTRRAEPGLVIDLAANGVPLGIEITAPSKLTLGALNRVLKQLGCPRLKRADLAPLRVA